MRKFLANPTVALILTVIVVISSTLISTHVKLGKLCDGVTSQFYSGYEPPIATSLRSFASSAEKLAILANQNAIDSKDVMTDVDAMRDLLRSESRKTAGIAQIYNRLLSEVFTLESQLARKELSESDADTLSVAQHDAAQAKAAIDASPYNETVQAFLKRYNRFPANVLAGPSGVQMPQSFA